MRFITDLHDRHAGETVWIAGSDPTLGEYPESFFDGKIAITLHLAHSRFPRATYRYANEYDRVAWLKRTYQEYAAQEQIFAWPFYGRSKGESRDLARDMPHAYYLWWSLYPPCGIREHVDWEFTRRKVRQARAGTSVIYGGHGTCLHGAMYAAVMMGANPINIIGCGHGRVAAQQEHFADVNAVDASMRPGIRSFSDPVNNVPMIEQTLALIEACRGEGIGVNWVRRFAGGALEPMQVDLIELGRLKEALARAAPPSALRRLKNALKRLYYPFYNSL